MKTQRLLFNEKRHSVPFLTPSRFLTWFACLMLVFTCACGPDRPDELASPWPASTPEEQGMDSAYLIDLLDNIEKERLNVHSILALRHGRTILEVYYPPFQPQDQQLQWSVTKSFVSTLIGIAVGEGKIQAPTSAWSISFLMSPLPTGMNAKNK